MIHQRTLVFVSLVIGILSASGQEPGAGFFSDFENKITGVLKNDGNIEVTAVDVDEDGNSKCNVKSGEDKDAIDNDVIAVGDDKTASFAYDHEKTLFLSVECGGDSAVIKELILFQAYKFTEYAVIIRYVDLENYEMGYKLHGGTNEETGTVDVTVEVMPIEVTDQAKIELKTNTNEVVVYDKDFEVRETESKTLHDLKYADGYILLTGQDNKEINVYYRTDTGFVKAEIKSHESSNLKLELPANTFSDILLVNYLDPSKTQNIKLDTLTASFDATKKTFTFDGKIDTEAEYKIRLEYPHDQTQSEKLYFKDGKLQITILEFYLGYNLMSVTKNGDLYWVQSKDEKEEMKSQLKGEGIPFSTLSLGKVFLLQDLKDLKK